MKIDIEPEDLVRLLFENPDQEWGRKKLSAFGEAIVNLIRDELEVPLPSEPYDYMQRSTPLVRKDR